MLQSSWGRNKSFGQLFAAVNKGNPWQHGAEPGVYTRLSSLGVPAGAACTARFRGAVKMSHGSDVTFQKKIISCFQSPFCCGMVGDTSHWKSVLINCLSGNAGEQRHPKGDLEL